MKIGGCWIFGVGKGTPVDKINKHNFMFCACVVVKQVTKEMGVGEL